MRNLMRVLVVVACAVCILSLAAAQQPEGKGGDPAKDKEKQKEKDQDKGKDYSTSSIVVKMMEFNKKKDGKLTIDASATLADGKTIKGHDGLAAILKADPAAFAECLAEKMLIYALGRGLDRSDRKAVKGLAQRMAREEYRFSSLVLGIVQSEPFQVRK